MTSEEANQARWDGRPGFFEIWFLVLFDPSAHRAWWLRYTTFAPASEQAGPPRATLWAAAFAAGAPPVAAKRIFPASAYGVDRERFGVHIGSALLTNGTCRGEVASATPSPGTSASRRRRVRRSTARGSSTTCRFPPGSRTPTATSRVMGG